MRARGRTPGPTPQHSLTPFLPTHSALRSAGRAFPLISLAVITTAVYCGVGHVLPALYGGVGGEGGLGSSPPPPPRPLLLALSTAAAGLVAFNLYAHFAGVATSRPPPGAGVRLWQRGSVPAGAYEGHTQCGPCGGSHKPPGTHHCASCGACSRWHDHHCFFTGTCLSTAPGDAGARHFLLMCAWLMVGAAYALAAVGALFLARRGEVAALVGGAVRGAGGAREPLPPPPGALARAAAAVLGRPATATALDHPFPPPLAPTAAAIRALSRAASAADRVAGRGGGPASALARAVAAAARLAGALLALPAAALAPASPPWFLAAFTLAGIAGAALTGVAALSVQVLGRMAAGASASDAGRPRLVLVGGGGGSGGREEEVPPPPPPASLRSALERVFGPGPSVRWLLPYGDGGGDRTKSE